MPSSTTAPGEKPRPAAGLTPWRRLRARLGLLFVMLLLLLLWAMLGWAGHHWSLRLDLSATRAHSLGAPSRAVLERLEAPLRVLAFVARPEARRAVRRFVGHYQRLSPYLELELVDPLVHPDRVREYRVQTPGELVLEYQERRAGVRPGQTVRHIPRYSEQAFSNALQRLVEPRRPLLGFLSGHGERDPQGRANHDLGDWAAYLGEHAYRVSVLPTLGRTSPIPGNLELLVIAGPRVPLEETERHLLEAYLERGGGLLWLMDPETPDRSGLRELARELGVAVAARPMRQARGGGQAPETMVLTTPDMYQAHQALEGFDLPALFPGAAALEQLPESTPGHEPGDTGAGWRRRALITPVEDTGEGDARQRYRQHNIALALERDLGPAPARPQRVVLVGDGDFLSNTYLGNGGNAELGLRLVNWLLSDSGRVVIPIPRPPDASLDLGGATLSRLRTLFAVILPALLLLAGFLLEARRRRL